MRVVPGVYVVHSAASTDPGFGKGGLDALPHTAVMAAPPPSLLSAHKPVQAVCTLGAYGDFLKTKNQLRIPLLSPQSLDMSFSLPSFPCSLLLLPLVCQGKLPNLGVRQPTWNGQEQPWSFPLPWESEESSKARQGTGAGRQGEGICLRALRGREGWFSPALGIFNKSQRLQWHSLIWKQGAAMPLYFPLDLPGKRSLFLDGPDMQMEKLVWIRIRSWKPGWITRRSLQSWALK